MSTLNLTRRGVISITSADTSPKDVALPAVVKTASSFRITNIRERRRDVFVQHGSIAITDADISPKDSAALGTAVDTTAAFVTNVTIREKRTNNIYGATVKLNSATVVRATFGTVAAGDTIDIDFDVVEHKARRGATARLLSETTLRVEWDGTLVAGETIDISYDVTDLEDLGDDIKEVLFRLQRILGIQGENSTQDLYLYDQAGNPTQFRVRVFDTDADLEASTKDLEEGEALEPGELSRHLVTLTWNTGKNRPAFIASVRTELLEPTPGVN